MVVTLEMVMENETLLPFLTGSNLISLYGDFEYELSEGYTYETSDLFRVQLAIKNILLGRLGEPLEVSR